MSALKLDQPLYKLFEVSLDSSALKSLGTMATSWLDLLTRRDELLFR